MGEEVCQGNLMHFRKEKKKKAIKTIRHPRLSNSK